MSVAVENYRSFLAHETTDQPDVLLKTHEELMSKLRVCGQDFFDQLESLGLAEREDVREKWGIYAFVRWLRFGGICSFGLGCSSKVEGDYSLGWDVVAGEERTGAFGLGKRVILDWDKHPFEVRAWDKEPLVGSRVEFRGNNEGWAMLINKIAQLDNPLVYQRGGRVVEFEFIPQEISCQASFCSGRVDQSLTVLRGDDCFKARILYGRKQKEAGLGGQAVALDGSIKVKVPYDLDRRKLKPGWENLKQGIFNEYDRSVRGALEALVDSFPPEVDITEIWQEGFTSIFQITGRAIADLKAASGIFLKQS